MPTLAEMIAARKPASTSPAAAPQVSHAPAGTPAAPSRLVEIKAALAKAKTGSRTNKLPLGVGWFLLKNGVFKQTEQKQRKISVFSFLCIKGIKDAHDLPPTSPNYTGPKEGEEYEVSIFQDGGFLDSTMTKNLQALQACMGWSSEYVKDLQSTEEGITAIMELAKGLLCVSLDGIPTNQPCAFANQVVVEILTKETVKEEKGSDGKPSYDEKGNKKMATYTNTYWQKKVPLADVAAAIPEANIIKAFGSQEAFLKAFETEQAVMAG